MLKTTTIVSLLSGALTMAVSATALAESESMWLSNERADDTFLTGVDFARLQLGCDLRVTPTVAISSVTTVSMTTYLGQYDHMNDELDEIGDKELSVNLFSGIMGRFDIPVGG